MDWVLKTNQIKRKLEDGGYPKLKEDIDSALMVLGTSGEMFMPVLDYLIQIKKNGTPGYELIKQDIEDMISYAKSINYL